MPRPKLRKSSSDTASASAPGPSDSPSFTLAVSGVVVQKQQLVAALKPFLPQLVDIEAFEDGERFLLVFGQPSGASESPGDQTV